MNRRWRAFHKRIYSNAQKWYGLDLDYDYFYLSATLTNEEKEILAKRFELPDRAGVKIANLPGWVEVSMSC